jgi:transaldolase
MKATERLHALGQSLWLDNIIRDLLTSGTLQHYVDELSVTGLTSNPSIFDHAITHSKAYDEEIRRQARRRSSPVCRSTLRCCSRVTIMCGLPMPICAAWNDAWPPG